VQVETRAESAWFQRLKLNHKSTAVKVCLNFSLARPCPKILSEALGGNCATTVLATLRLGEWERSAAVMDLVGAAGRAPTFPAGAYTRPLFSST
jgi:hypothetical protein